MSTGAVLRPAEPSDLEAVVDVFLACWTTSYAATLGSAFATTMTRERATAMWLTRPITDVVIAVDRDADGAEHVLGLVRADTGSVRAGSARIAQVHSLYVSPRAQAGGLGGALLDAALAAATDAGCTGAELWVFAGNAPSVRFYERRGWRPDGRRRVEPEFGIPEQGMSIRLPLQARA